MAKSKTKIEKQLKKKTNPELVETIIFAKKNKNWNKIAEILSSPRRNKISLNLSAIEKESDGKVLVVPGKVLSSGDVTKKIKIVALNFSKSAKEKLLNAKCEISSILEEIKQNPDAKNIKIIGK